MKKYISELISLNFSTKKALNEKIQNLLDDYSQKGYSLHSCNLNNDFCVIVFERNSNDDAFKL